MKQHVAAESELTTILKTAGLDESYISQLEDSLRRDEENRLSGNGIVYLLFVHHY